MNTYLHKHFNIKMNKIIEDQKLQSIIVGISGGQDSMCLLKLIEDFKKKTKSYIKIEYIYIDHQWKNDSKYQIKHLINYIKLYKNTISIYQIQKLVISEIKARELRYKIIINHALNYQNSAIITGHTKTDKIETFLQQLIRGTSIDGATSLIFKRKLNTRITLFRPLLDINRSEINWFCRKFYMPIWSDITNYYYNISRNRLRYEFIPYLNNYFMFNIENNLNDFLNISNIENEYIKQNAIKLYIISRHKKNIALNYKLLKIQHFAIQTRTLQLFFYHNFNKSLNKDMLMKLIFITNKKYNKAQLLQWNHLIIHIEYQWIYIS
uniref:tRNA(Ile)-lysidine synthase n=1 Tax=Inkyuleea mariana TaxID=123988 RepID=A0A4D6X2E8_9FLOR|nr:tRNA Ile-lysidine synthetase [Inkyuleea mariana]